MTIEDIKILVAVPHDLYFCSEVEVQIVNMRKFEYSKQLVVLVFEENKETKSSLKDYWNKMQSQYSEVTFKFYSTDNFNHLLKVYPQIVRPWMMSEYWKEFPDTNNVLYLDSDVLFTRPIELSVFSDDSICYLSATNYISSKYFDSKEKDVMFHMQEQYKQIDVLSECCRIVGIDKQTVINNLDNTGGCQYLLRGIDSSFWNNVVKSCIELRLYTFSINQKFFISEDKGFQSWAIGDMCGLLWNLWKLGIKTECPDEMNFSWSSSLIQKYEECLFFHNAGIPGKYIMFNGEKERVYCKTDTRFRTGVISVFDIRNWGELSKKLCSYKYVEAIKKVENPVCITNNIDY